jgi:hypothetical protein
MIKTYALRLVVAAVSLTSVAASAREGDCVRCDLTAGVMQVKCQSGYPATALFCIDDVTSFISYLEDQGRICPPLPPTREEERSDFLKVVRAMIRESKDRPEAEAIEVAYQALVEDFPCN